jgi:hypothetical protein
MVGPDPKSNPGSSGIKGSIQDDYEKPAMGSDIVPKSFQGKNLGLYTTL